MSPEVIQIVVPLTFIGICGLAGEILVQGRRDKTAEERLQMHASREAEPHCAKKARMGRADARS
jgi:hypothetical protein